MSILQRSILIANQGGQINLIEILESKKKSWLEKMVAFGRKQSSKEVGKHPLIEPIEVDSFYFNLAAKRTRVSVANVLER